MPFRSEKARATRTTKGESISHPWHINLNPTSSSSPPFSRQLLNQLVKQNLIPLELATQIDPMLLNDGPVHGEPGDDADFSAYLESKMMYDIPSGEIRIWIERIWNDPGCHPMFAAIVTKVRESLFKATHFKFPTSLSASHLLFRPWTLTSSVRRANSCIRTIAHLRSSRSIRGYVI